MNVEKQIRAHVLVGRDETEDGLLHIAVMGWRQFKKLMPVFAEAYYQAECRNLVVKEVALHPDDLPLFTKMFEDEDFSFAEAEDFPARLWGVNVVPRKQVPINWFQLTAE